MALVLMKDMPGWCEDDFVALSEDRCLKYIDRLGKVCHTDSVRVIVEDIEGDSRNKGIGNGIVLLQKARIRARFWSEPVAPFIHDHGNPLVRVVFIHNL